MSTVWAALADDSLRVGAAIAGAWLASMVAVACLCARVFIWWATREAK